MLIKKLKYGVLLFSVISASAFATEQHSISLGYAMAPQKVLSEIDKKPLKQHKLKSNGINLQYRYETESPWGAVISATYLKGTEKNTKTNKKTRINNMVPGINNNTVQRNPIVETKQFSLLAGPSYRFNEYFSTYALVGVAKQKISLNYTNPNNNISSKSNINKTSFAYGTGIAINPASNVSMYIGFEGNRYVRGFNAGIGYRF